MLGQRGKKKLASASLRPEYNASTPTINFFVRCRYYQKRWKLAMISALRLSPPVHRTSLPCRVNVQLQLLLRARLAFLKSPEKAEHSLLCKPTTTFRRWHVPVRRHPHRPPLHLPLRNGDQRNLCQATLIVLRQHQHPIPRQQEGRKPRASKFSCSQQDLTEEVTIRRLRVSLFLLL